MDSSAKLATQGTQEEETGNIGYTRRRKTQHNMCQTPLYTNKNTTQYVLDTTIHKQKHNTICVRHHYTQTKTQHNMCQTPLYTNKNKLRK